MYPDFPLDSTEFFSGEHLAPLNPIFGDIDAGISRFHLHISIVIFDAEQVYFRPQVSNFKIKEVTTNP